MCERVTQLTRLFWQSCKPAARQAKQVPHLCLRLYFPCETPEVLYQKFNLRVFLVFCCVSVGGCRYLQGSLNCSFSMFYQTSLGTRDIPRNMLFRVKENFFLSIPAGYYYNIKIVIFIEKQRSNQVKAELYSTPCSKLQSLYEEHHLCFFLSQDLKTNIIFFQLLD